MIEIDPVRLAHITTLAHGAHDDIGDGACVMEALAYVTHSTWSDHPPCASKVIGAFLRAWNDGLPQDERDALLLPLIPRLAGTAASEQIEHRRSLMAADWLVRVHTPAWLRLAGLMAQAESLEALPEIVDMAQVPSIRGPIEAVRRDASAAWAAARDAAWAAAGDAARDAAWAAAGDAAWAAAGYAARDAAGDAAWAAARNAAWAAARDAAWAAAGAKLKPTCDALQQSALALVERMIALGDEARTLPADADADEAGPAARPSTPERT